AAALEACAPAFDALGLDCCALRAGGLLASIPRLTRLRPRHLRCTPLRLIRRRPVLDRRQVVFFKEGPDRQLPEIRQRRPQSVVIPVPPREPVQPLRHGSRKALPNDARRVAGDDRIGIAARAPAAPAHPPRPPPHPPPPPALPAP